ncbi:hypothetical protein EAH78_16170 [Pseudomonas arsenicoxydans]|uniref:Uncharacterized protein n=1 Tax=Pseudomonas arsenicoxydans TaxID=702115 RepID=A0A502HPL4_9PSED|nr:hypothetical protein EAH78_16170 [Pseudomonas arsenicoxydans]
MKCLNHLKERFLWRGSLLPLGCEAVPTLAIVVFQANGVAGFTTAAQSSGSKLPRHRGVDDLG